VSYFVTVAVTQEDGEEVKVSGMNEVIFGSNPSWSHQLRPLAGKLADINDSTFNRVQQHVRQ
jgi:hypothetical protein